MWHKIVMCRDNAGLTIEFKNKHTHISLFLFVFVFQKQTKNKNKQNKHWSDTMAGLKRSEKAVDAKWILSRNLVLKNT